MDQLTDVRWAHLRPDDFLKRQGEFPLIYLPLGLCEPHGHIAPFGLDTLKADYYCEQAAERFGGIVAPTQGYHIHECGDHGPWLDETVGPDQNPYLGGMPPYVVCYHLLYQLRAFVNAGFRAIVGVSGHHGPSPHDLRKVGDAFAQATGIPVKIQSDPEWCDGLYENDHAGKYEISQLMAIYPESIEMGLIDRMNEPGSGGRLALNPDAGESTAEHGVAINEAIIGRIGEHVKKIDFGAELSEPLSYEVTESIWKTIIGDGQGWFSM